MRPPKKLSVLVAHHAPMIRYCLAKLMQSDTRFTVTGETGEAPVARRLFREFVPDLVVLSLTLQHGDGYSLLKDLRKTQPAVRALIVSGRRDSLSVQRAFKAGAKGYVTSADDPAEVLKALERISEGERYVSDSVAQGLLLMLANGSVAARGNGCEELSDRELQVFRLIGSGLGTSRVARELQVSVKTIETHRQRIKQKLGLTTGAELTQRAVNWLMQTAREPRKRNGQTKDSPHRF